MEHRAARARAAAVRVPVVIGRGTPVAVPAILVFQRIRGNAGFGVVAIVEVHTWQLDFTVLEVQCLADAEALALEATVFDPATGHAQGQFILVTNTVGAREAVVTKQRCIVERVFACIEYRDVFLVDLRHVQIEQAWLEGLAVVLAEILGIAIEVQAAVDAGDRYAAVLVAVERSQEFVLFGGLIGNLTFAGAVQVQLVLGVLVLELRCQEAVRCVHRQTDGRREIQAVAIGAGQTLNVFIKAETADAVFVKVCPALQIPVKPYEFGVVREIQAFRMIRQHAVEGELRQAVVRRNVRYARQLVCLGIYASGIAVAAIGDRALLVHVVAAFDANLVGLQILEVIRIADLGVVDLREYSRVETTLVLPVVHVAGFFGVALLVAFVAFVVEVRRTELAFAGFGQVAEFAFHQQAVLFHVARVQRGIVVRRQVEVVRGDQHEAGIAAGADGRRQEARLATVVDREIDVRRVQDRNVLDPQRHVGRRTETGGRVQGDVVALELPGVAVRFARGVRTILEADDRVLGTFGVQRITADARFVHHVFGVVDLGFTGVELHVGVVADDQGAVVANAHVAVQLATAFGLVQVGFVGFDLHAALTHDNVAGQGRNLLILLIAGGLCADKGWGVTFIRLVIHARTNRFDIGTGAIRTGFGQLCGGKLLAGNPVEVTVVCATRLQATAFGFGDQHRLGAGVFAGTALGRGFAGSGDCAAVMDGTRWQCSRRRLWRTVPGTRSRD
ncbi:hypothetical protein D3C75_492520 [compost metagenome]